MPALAALTCVIPLFQSHRFMAILERNIATHLRHGASVLVSDQHGDAHTVARLVAKFGHVGTFSAWSNDSGASWVDNISFLLSNVDTEFARVLPHDDSASPWSSSLLVQALAEQPAAVLAFGTQIGLDLDNARLPHMTNMQRFERCNERPWSHREAHDLAWSARFNGAFKGVLRTAVVKDGCLPIRKTNKLVYSERAWLFALALRGRFVLVPESRLYKRFYDGSTHRKWTVGPEEVQALAVVLEEYVSALIAEEHARAMALRNVRAGAKAMLEWMRSGGSFFAMPRDRLKFESDLPAA